MEKNLSQYKELKPHYKKRMLWTFVNHTIYRLLRPHFLNPARNVILKAFGAEITSDSCVCSSATVFAPWNLKMGRAIIGPGAYVYNKAMVILGDDCVVSQNSELCTASHDITSLVLPVKNAPITLCDKVWVASHVFVGPGVTIGEGAVVGARAAVFKDVEPWTVVGGNPAKFLKKRVIAE